MSELASLRDLDDRPSIFVLPTDDVVGDLLIPALSVADQYRCMVGFFDSGALRSLGPGLASFIHRSQSPVRILASPVVSDRDAYVLGQTEAESSDDLLEQGLLKDFEAVLDSPETLGSALATHTLACLAYLIREERLRMRLVFVRDGLFHLKVWLFNQGNDLIAANGSNNMTNRALSTNVEQVRIERSWAGGGEEAAASRFALEFERYWDGSHDHAVAIEATEAARRHLLQRYPPSSPPTEQDYFDALAADMSRHAPINPGLTVLAADNFQVPSYLEYRSGEYSHQGAAVDAWRKNRGLGILELATGAGKTITSLIAARQLQDEAERLLTVVAVPSRPLLNQWVDDIRQFGVEPVVPSAAGSRIRKLNTVRETCRNAKYGSPGTRFLLVTHEMLVDPEFCELLMGCHVSRMLIADEMHRLGRAKFLANPPDFFEFRLGLSATPELQYRPDESDQLAEFFGGVVFRFGLEEAIGKCLVPYNYFVHDVRLSEDEAERWMDLTAKLRASGYRSSDEGIDDATSALLARRRAVLEQAEAKLPALRSLLQSVDPIEVQHTLIYSSDKGPDQHDAVGEMLNDLGLISHQITERETGHPDLVASILRRFAEGELQVITAKRVLDEGVNIPEVKCAYLLSSTTMERQWVQRRGRILRQCKRLGKTHADLHDFLVLPPHGWQDSDLDRMVGSELRRLTSFAELAMNVGTASGPLPLLQHLSKVYIKSSVSQEDPE